MMLRSTDDEAQSPNSSPQMTAAGNQRTKSGGGGDSSTTTGHGGVISSGGGGGSGFCSFHQLAHLVSGIVADPSTLEENRIAVEISLCALLGITGKPLAPPATQTSASSSEAIQQQPVVSSRAGSGGLCSASESELTGDNSDYANAGPTVIKVKKGSSPNTTPSGPGAPGSNNNKRKSKLVDIEHVAFVLSTAFNCPNAELMAIFQRALKDAVEAETISSNFTRLLPQGTNNNNNNNGDGDEKNNSDDSQKKDDAPSFHNMDSCSKEDREKGFCWCVNPPSLALPHLLTSPSALKTHTDELHANLLANIFTETSELANFTRIMSVLPPLLQAEHHTWQFLMEDPESPMLVEERLMVAIMAATRHHCEYFTKKLLLRALVTPTFPQSWLDGPLPPKFEAFATLVALLAHRPWQITPQHIADVLDADVTPPPTSSNSAAGEPELEPWNLTSVVHAVCIATNVISLCGFATLFQIPFEPSTAALPMELGQPEQVYLRTAENVTLNDNATANESGGSAPVMNYSNIPFHRFRPQQTNCTDMWTILTGEAGDGQCAPAADIGTYDKRIKRVDKKSERDKNSVDIGNFSWENHACTVIENHYPGVASCMAEEKASYEEITSAMETSAMRFRGTGACPQAEEDDEVWRGVSVYIHNLFGVTHPDFDYGTINKLLDKEVKRFIHKATAVPEDTIVEDFQWTTPNVDPVLYVAVAVGAISARREAMLLQFTYHFDKYLREYC